MLEETKGGCIMLAKIQKWGNSQGIRIPKSILSSAEFAEDEEVEIVAINNKIVISSVMRYIKNIKEIDKEIENNSQYYK